MQIEIGKNFIQLAANLKYLMMQRTILAHNTMLYGYKHQYVPFIQDQAVRQSSRNVHVQHPLFKPHSPSARPPPQAPDPAFRL